MGEGIKSVSTAPSNHSIEKHIFADYVMHICSL